MLNALREAGIINQYDYVRRVVIDLQAGEVPVIHIERFGDERMLRVVPSLGGVEVDYITSATDGS